VTSTGRGGSQRKQGGYETREGGHADRLTQDQGTGNKGQGTRYRVISAERQLIRSRFSNDKASATAKKWQFKIQSCSMQPSPMLFHSHQ